MRKGKGALSAPHESSRALPSSSGPGSRHAPPQPHQTLPARGKKRKRGHASSDVQSSSKQEPLAVAFGHDTDVPLDDGEQTWTQSDSRSTLRKNKIKVTRLFPTSNQSAKVESQLYPRPFLSFDHLRTRYSVSRRLNENVQSQGYKEPTEVQMGSIPLLLAKNEQNSLSATQDLHATPPPSSMDLLAVAPTGSGKTLAFLIPTLQSLIEEQTHHGETTSAVLVSRGPQAIILAPSHELVEQIVNEGRKLAQGTGIRISALKKNMRIFGLEQTSPQYEDDESENGQRKVKALSLLKSDVIVSTPPMLLGAISRGSKSSVQALPSVRRLVFDEADILLDEMFFARTLAIWNACVNPALRISLWSATMSSSIEKIVQKQILDRRKRIVPEQQAKSHDIVRLVVGLKDSSIPNIDHRLVFAASEQGKLVALRQLMHPAPTNTDDNDGLRPPFLVFTQTIPRAIALHSELLYDIPPEAGGSSRIAVLHSELLETTRSTIMAAVRKGDIWILITTDLLSRGIDFKGMNGVVSYDIPSTSASYVHRAGRTGRQGRDGGIAVTLYTKEDIPYVKNVANVIASSTRAKAVKATGAPNTTEEDLQRWLLDSLPDVSKKTRQKLKQSGIEHRNSKNALGYPNQARATRISTKSGYDRKVQNRRRAAAERRRGNGQDSHKAEGNLDEGDEWAGFD